MKAQAVFSMIVFFVGALLLSGCSTSPQKVTMDQPYGQQPKTMDVSKSTWTGKASGEQAHDIADEIAETNNNTMEQLNKMEAKEESNTKLTNETLAKQGSGEITLFFKNDSAELDAVQTQRLVNFLDYVSRESQGRKVILALVGQASATGTPESNKELSVERSQAPQPVIDQYLMNVPHDFHQVVGKGDQDAPKDASPEVNQRYQNVSIAAVYDIKDLPEKNVG